MKRIPRRFVPLLIKDVPVDVKARFKAYCAERGVTMKDAIVYLMDMTVREGRRVRGG